MKTLFQPFAALAIRFCNDEFWCARLKLTALYVLVTAFILASFSSFLYYEVEDQLAEYTLGDNALLDDGDEDDTEREPFVDEFISDFEDNILLANVLILFLIGLLGYWLAGKTLHPIQEKMRQQQQFSRDVAHEIRTPLSAMLARTESVLRKEESNDTYKKALNEYREETKRLIDLTENLLLSAQQEANVSIETLSLNLMAKRVTDRLFPLANKKRVTIKEVYEEEGIVEGNRALLERLLQNIIYNAIKFTPEGGKITITVNKKTITIADTGIGMSIETKKKAFDRFYTADSARDERGERGSGLGLAIVKEIAMLHNATVSIDSEEENGTTVSVSFLQ